MAYVRNTSLVSAECIGEDLSANNKEYMVLGDSEGRKIISNKNEPKQFKNGKQLTLETATNSRRQAVQKHYRKLTSCKPTEFLPEDLAISDLRSYPPSLIFRRGEGGHDTFTCRIVC